MAKEEVLTFEGMIDEILPGGRFRVELENGHRLIAYPLLCTKGCLSGRRE